MLTCTTTRKETISVGVSYRLAHVASLPHSVHHCSKVMLAPVGHAQRSCSTDSIALLALTACETVKGAGRDLNTAGTAITQEAQQAQTAP